jgi:hypothetical protein
MKKIIALVILLTASFFLNLKENSCCAQNVGINSTGAMPAASAILDIDAVPLNNKGLLIPRLTNVQRDNIAVPAGGLLIYNTSTKKINEWDGIEWIEIATTSIPSINLAGINTGTGVAMGATPTPPHHSALLDVNGTTGGFLIPRMTTAQRNAIVAPATGLIIYNISTNATSYFDGITWIELCGTPVSNLTGAITNTRNVSINTTGTPPDPSSLLDISSTTKGLLIPRLTSLKRDSIKSPAQGLIIYNITTNRINVFNGSTAWLELVPAVGIMSVVATAANGITRTSFTANWNASANSTNYFLDVSTDPAFASFVGIYNNLNVGNVTSYSVNSGITCGTTYYYRIRPANPCAIITNSNVITVTTMACCTLIADAGSNQTIMCTTTIGGSPSASSGTASYTYNWSPAAGVSNTAAANPTIALTSTTTFTLIVTDATGCIDTSNVTITVTPGLAAPIATAADTITTTSFYANWDTVAGATNYFIDVATDPTFTSFVGIYNNLSVGNDSIYAISGLLCDSTYYFRIRASNPCDTSLNSNTIAVTTAPCCGLIADAGVDQNVSCIVTIGGSPTATGGVSPYTYSWSPSAGLNNATIANPDASPNATTTYTVTVTDANGCTDTNTVTLTVLACISDTWCRKADLGGLARRGAVGFSIGNKGYIGTGGNGVVIYQDFWEYDPATNAWTQKANYLGGPRWFATGFSIGTKGYIGTGQTSTGSLAASQDFYEYDPTTNLWTQKANYLGGQRVAPCGFATATKGYIGTGYDPVSGSYMQDFYEYNPATNTWIPRNSLPGPARYVAVGFSINGIGYLGTGWNGADVGDFYSFNPATNT